MGIGNHERPGRGGSDNWLTPISLISKIGLNFDLDPCGVKGHKTAKTIYTDKGLTRDWFGNVWLNPPYSEVEIWLDHLYRHGNGMALVFARTDTKWAQAYLPKAKSVLFLSGRIKFLMPDLTLPKWTSGAPSMLMTFGYCHNFSGMNGWLVNNAS